MARGYALNPDTAWRNVYIVNATPDRTIHHSPQFFGEQTKRGNWRGVVFWKVGYIYRFVHLMADSKEGLLELMRKVEFRKEFEGVDEIPAYWLERKL